jgi:hypothetical protein
MKLKRYYFTLLCAITTWSFFSSPAFAKTIQLTNDFEQITIAPYCEYILDKDCRISFKNKIHVKLLSLLYFDSISICELTGGY